MKRKKSALNILVDTCVWSLLLHRKQKSQHTAAIILQHLISAASPVYITGIIFQELLQGIKSAAQATDIKSVLKHFPNLDATLAVHELAAEIFVQCRKRGFATHTVDALIAATCLYYDCTLLTTDSDFQRIAKLFPLKLLN